MDTSGMSLASASSLLTNGSYPSGVNTNREAVEDQSAELPFVDQLNEARGRAAGKLDQQATLTARHLQEVEGLFISMMLKNLRSSETGEGLFAGDKSDTFGGMFDMYLGEHLAESGGVGLSQMLQESRLQTSAPAFDPSEIHKLYSVAVHAYQQPVEE